MGIELPIDYVPRVERLLEDARECLRQSIPLDDDGAFPVDDIEALAGVGALVAPLPMEFGGLGLGTTPRGARPLFRLLRTIGAASLPLGRLFEGHVNALSLINRYGDDEQRLHCAREAAAGALFAVWNTEDAVGVRLETAGSGLVLKGRKTYASGAGFAPYPLITARAGDDKSSIRMILPRLNEAARRERSDLSLWRAHGMRASATGTFDFTDLPVEQFEIVGEPGDYHREPAFSTGAWRFAAVQLGGVERLLDELRIHLRATGRGGDPHQLARAGQAAIATETARLWVERAADLAEDPGCATDIEQSIAYVNLARSVVERAGLDVLELVHRSIGLSAFLRAHPVERLSRDLSTYLRQPAPDRALTMAAAHVLTSERGAADLWS